MIEVTLNQVRTMFMAMDKISKEKITKQFAYGLAKNKARLKEDIEAIAEAEKIGVEFDNERIAICEKYATKDADGKPVTENNAYVGLNDNQLFLGEMNDLHKKYEPMIKETNELMNKKVGIEFYMIPFESVPEEIAGTDMEILMPMIAEPKE